MSPELGGQCTGQYSGTNAGTIVADLERAGEDHGGVVFAYDHNPALPKSFAFVKIPHHLTRLTLRVPLLHVERGTGTILTKETLSEHFPGVDVPTYADTEWEISTTEIVV